MLELINFSQDILNKVVVNFALYISIKIKGQYKLSFV